MSNGDKYKAAFSQVHTAVDIEMTINNQKTRQVHRFSRRMAALIAAACLLLALSATAFAMNFFGLRDLVLHVGGEEDAGYPLELISMQGYSDSSEYKAIAEWTEFCNGYDKDGSLLAKVGNGPTGLDEKYDLYLVYTQEMADKLDQIMSKYSLKLHRTIDFYSGEELFERAGLDDFLDSPNTPYGGYIYEDGTFLFEGYVTFEDVQDTVNYQFMNCEKGSFTDVALNIGDADDYEEWAYETDSGVTVNLAIGTSKCLITADMGGSFVVVNVLAGTGSCDGGMTASSLEAFADTFDFSGLK